MSRSDRNKKSNMRWGWGFLALAFVAFGSPEMGFFILLAFGIKFLTSETSENQTRVKTSRGSDKKRVKMNTNLKEYFKTHESIMIDENVTVQARVEKNSHTQILEVYYSGEYICRFDEFRRHFPTTYDQLIDILYNLTLNKGVMEEPVFTQSKPQVDVTPKKEAPPIPKEQVIDAVYFINKIDTLNQDIVKEEVTNDLFESTAMLKQIANIEQKYPDSKEKLGKLYQYYLPILVSILENYAKLINSNSTHEEIDKLEVKLRKTIILVNEALKTITMQMCEDEIIDLNSDMSVLEAILRKDGLVRDGTLKGSRGSE